MTTPNRNNIETVVSDLEKYTKMANPTMASVGLTDPSSRKSTSAAMPGHLMRKREAEGKLEVLRAEYISILKRGLGAIFLNGTDEQASDFKAISGESAVYVQVDGLYSALTDAVDGTMRKDRMFEPQNFAHLDTALARMASDQGFTAPRLAYKRAKIVGNRSALLDYIRDTVRDADKDKTNIEVITKSIAKQALERGFTGKSLPVVLTGSTKSETAALKSLFSGRVVVIDLPADQKVTQETVSSAFSELKKSFKKK